MQTRAVLLVALVTACRGVPSDSPGDDDATAPDASLDAPVDLDDPCGALDPRAQPLEVVATPEAGEAPYLAALTNATTSIDLAVYLMGYGGILDALQAKAAAGVHVRVLLAEGRKDTNQKYYDQLAAAGVEVKWSSPLFQHFHVKYFIVDGAVAVMSTGNFSKTFSIERERNFVATIRDRADIADLQTMFDTDWQQTAGLALSCTRLIVSPINARERLIGLIDSAQQTLEIESMQFADRDIRDAVARRVADGVTVRALLAEASWIDANADAASFLKGLGVPVKSIPHLHTKAIIADGQRVYIGSENFSYTSLDKNREVGVFVGEASSVAPVRATFEQDWAAGAPF